MSPHMRFLMLMTIGVNLLVAVTIHSWLNYGAAIAVLVFWTRTEAIRERARKREGREERDR